MKRIKFRKDAKVNNWLTHKETRDDIWDFMANKWALKTKGLAKYGKPLLPKPFKKVLRASKRINLQSNTRYKFQKKDAAINVNKGAYLSGANK